MVDEGHPLVRGIGLPAGPLLGVVTWWISSGSLPDNAAIVAGLLVAMAIWWLTLAVDLAITALLPILLLPILGIGSFAENAAPYASDIIFLFGGGFVLATALERYGISDRFARGVVAVAGSSAPAIVAALMVATALVSAFVSNTATVAAMLPIALAMVRAADLASHDHERVRRFGTACMLGVAYAATIGGVMTIIGSPPNAVAARAVESATGSPVSFARWMTYGVPLALLMLPVAWFVLAVWLFPVRGLSVPPPTSVVQTAGPTGASIARGSRRVAVVFGLTVALWIGRPWWTAWIGLPVTDAGIAIAASVALFVLPSSIRPWRPLLVWSDLARLPWGVLLLFGGGLSLADAVQRSGVAAALADSASGLDAMPPLVVLLLIATATCFGSEIASNTALAATAMPVLSAFATSTGSPPEDYLVTAALGASLAFMLPVGTPPNAMVYATGRVSTGAMARAGLVLNVVGIAAIVLVMSLVP